MTPGAEPMPRHLGRLSLGYVVAITTRYTYGVSRTVIAAGNPQRRAIFIEKTSLNRIYDAWINHGG